MALQAINAASIAMDQEGVASAAMSDRAVRATMQQPARALRSRDANGGSFILRMITELSRTPQTVMSQSDTLGQADNLRLSALPSATHCVGTRPRSQAVRLTEVRARRYHVTT